MFRPLSRFESAAPLSGRVTPTGCVAATLKPPPSAVGFACGAVPRAMHDRAVAEVEKALEAARTEHGATGTLYSYAVPVAANWLRVFPLLSGACDMVPEGQEAAVEALLLLQHSARPRAAVTPISKHARSPIPGLVLMSPRGLAGRHVACPS